MAVPGSSLRKPVTSDLCCFCGALVEGADGERSLLTVLWVQDGEEREQSWSAHRTCVGERMHETVKGAGVFFGD